MRFIANVKWAVAGIRAFFSSEKNGRIQGVIAVVVVILGFCFRLSPTEWVAILGCIASVLCLEMINSAIEKVCNLITAKYHPAVKTIKDMSAGAVLLASFISAIIGAIIFLPYIFRLLQN